MNAYIQHRLKQGCMCLQTTTFTSEQTSSGAYQHPQEDSSARHEQQQPYRQSSGAYAQTQDEDMSAGLPDLGETFSRRQGKATRRAELEDAVYRLRDALQAEDPDAGQQAATHVAMLLRSQTQSSSRSAMHASNNMRSGGDMHGTQTDTHMHQRSHEPRHMASPSPPRSPPPRRSSRNSNSARNAMTQTNTRKPQANTSGSGWGTQRGTQQDPIRGHQLSRDAACSPPPRHESSIRFHTRPEWDDSFHLTRPTTPRPPRRNVVYPIDDAFTPRNATSAAQMISSWRIAKRIEQARSLSPKREVPQGLSMMGTRLRAQQSPLGRSSGNVGMSRSVSLPQPKHHHINCLQPALTVQSDCYFQAAQVYIRLSALARSPPNTEKPSALTACCISACCFITPILELYEWAAYCFFHTHLGRLLAFTPFRLWSPSVS